MYSRLNAPEDIKFIEMSESGILVWRHDDILTYEFKEGVFDNTVKSIKQEFEILIRWTKEGKKPLLVGSKNSWLVGHRKYNYMQGSLAVFANSLAYIVDSNAVAFQTNVLSFLNKSEVPTRSFSGPDSSIEWLLQYSGVKKAIFANFG